MVRATCERERRHRMAVVRSNNFHLYLREIERKDWHRIGELECAVCGAKIILRDLRWKGSP